MDREYWYSNTRWIKESENKWMFGDGISDEVSKLYDGVRNVDECLKNIPSYKQTIITGGTLTSYKNEVTKAFLPLSGIIKDDLSLFSELQPSRITIGKNIKCISLSCIVTPFMNTGGSCTIELLKNEIEMVPKYIFYGLGLNIYSTSGTVACPIYFSTNFLDVSEDDYFQFYVTFAGSNSSANVKNLIINVFK